MLFLVLLAFMETAMTTMMEVLSVPCAKRNTFARVVLMTTPSTARPVFEEKEEEKKKSTGTPIMHELSMLPFHVPSV